MIIKNNKILAIGKPRLDRLIVGTKLRYSEYLFQKGYGIWKLATSKEETPYMCIGDESWAIVYLDTIKKKIKLSNANITVTIDYKSRKTRNSNFLMVLPGKVLTYNDPEDIVYKFLECLRDEYKCSAYSKEDVHPYSIDICRDLDIKTKPLVKLLKDGAFVTKIRGEGSICENFDIDDLEDKSGKLSLNHKAITGETGEGAGREVTLTATTKINNPSTISLSYGKRNRNGIKIYDKKAEQETKGQPPLYNGNYRNLTRVECSLNRMKIKSFKDKNSRQIISLKQVVENLAGLYRYFFSTAIRVPRKKFKTRNTKENHPVWNLILEGLDDCDSLARGDTKLDKNLCYDLYKNEIKWRTQKTQVRNRIHFVIKSMETDKEVFQYLRNILTPENMDEKSSLFEKFCQEMNSRYGTLSRNPHEAAKQIRDGYFSVNAYPTEKVDATTVTPQGNNAYNIGYNGHGVILGSGNEYIQYSKGKIISCLTYETAIRLKILSPSCLQKLNDGIFNAKETINFIDLVYDIRRLLINQYDSHYINEEASV